MSGTDEAKQFWQVKHWRKAGGGDGDDLLREESKISYSLTFFLF